MQVRPFIHNHLKHQRSSGLARFVADTRHRAWADWASKTKVLLQARAHWMILVTGCLGGKTQAGSKKRASRFSKQVWPYIIKGLDQQPQSLQGPNLH
jgi:hypothetical protein